MHHDHIDLSEVRFRNPDVRHVSRREKEVGTPFWRMVGAVFVALCLYGLLQTLVTVALVRHAVKDLERQFHTLLSSPNASVVAPAPIPTRTTTSRRTAPHLPVHPGPIEARRAGLAQACVGGFVTSRVEGGWSQTRQRCTATSD